MSQPSAYVNKYLTACDGDQISMTCIHGRAASGTTRWIIRPPVNCMTNIIHNPPLNTPQPCGPFTFSGITAAEEGVTQLSSTAMATATTMMSGSLVECRSGNVVSSQSVGNLTLCIIGQLM